MAQKIFHIILRCDNLDDPGKVDAIRELAKTCARTLHAGATLILPDPPRIFLQGEDFLMGKEQIEVVDPKEGT